MLERLRRVLCFHVSLSCVLLPPANDAGPTCAVPTFSGYAPSDLSIRLSGQDPRLRTLQPWRLRRPWRWRRGQQQTKKQMRWQLLWLLGFALRRGSACPGRQHPFPRAVETSTAPSNAQFYRFSRPITLLRPRALTGRALWWTTKSTTFFAELQTAHLVELAGIEPASSTHPLQPSGAEAPHDHFNCEYDELHSP